MCIHEESINEPERKRNHPIFFYMCALGLIVTGSLSYWFPEDALGWEEFVLTDEEYKKQQMLALGLTILTTLIGMYSVWLQETAYAKSIASTMPDDKHDHPSDVEAYYDEKEDDDDDNDDDEDDNDDTDDTHDHKADDNDMYQTLVKDFGAMANSTM